MGISDVISSFPSFPIQQEKRREGAPFPSLPRASLSSFSGQALGNTRRLYSPGRWWTDTAGITQSGGLARHTFLL